MVRLRAEAHPEGGRPSNWLGVARDIVMDAAWQPQEGHSAAADTESMYPTPAPASPMQRSRTTQPTARSPRAQKDTNHSMEDMEEQEERVTQGKGNASLDTRESGTPERLRIVAPHEQATLGHLLPDVPHEAEDLVAPHGYSVSSSSTNRLKAYNAGNAHGEPVMVPQSIAPAPILITRRMRDIETGDEHLEVAWLKDRWHKHIESRAALMDTRELVKKLAGKGLPVTSRSAGDVADYLNAFEAANLQKLPVTHVSRHLGWQGERGEYGFLWGKMHITSDEHAPVTFRGPSTGDEQLARGFRSKGSLEAWLEGIEPIQHHPKALLGFYAAFVAPLLDIVDCPNFIIDWGSRTSTGKTTVLRIAASICGNPNEDAADTILGSWDTTRVAVERRCGLSTGLPVFLDDTKKAKKEEVIKEVVYSATSGQGRGRGNLEGQERTQVWRTVLLSTGEASILSFSTAGGARGRVLPIRGLPFDSPKMDKLVRSLNGAVTANYGHAMPLFLRAVLARKDEWKQWSVRYAQERERLVRLGNNNVASRLAAYCAAVSVTAKLVHEVFEQSGHRLPWRDTGQLEALWKTILAETDEAAVDIRALEDVRGWVLSNEAKFEHRTPSSTTSIANEPPGGWLGVLFADSRVAFFTDKLADYLKRLDYHPEEVLSGWKERGWLELDKEKKHKQVPFGTSKVRMPTLRAEVWGKPEDEGEKEQPTSRLTLDERIAVLTEQQRQRIATTASHVERKQAAGSHVTVAADGDDLPF